MQLGRTKAQPPKEKINIKDNAKKVYKHDGIIFSFDILKLDNEYFTLDGTCASWTALLLERLHQVSKLTPGQLVSGGYSTFRVHKYDADKANFKPPDNISEDDFIQIRFEKSKGGIHGVLTPDGIFYVVWLDPQHNMYDSEGYGGKVKITPPNTCCKERESLLSQLYEEISILKDTIADRDSEINGYIEEIESIEKSAATKELEIQSFKKSNTKGSKSKKQTKKRYDKRKSGH